MSNQDFILPILPREPNKPVTPLDQMHVSKIIKKQRLDVHQGKGSDNRTPTHAERDQPRRHEKDEDHQIDEYI